VRVQQFLKQRFAALKSGDYAAVYDSYHADAPFLRQFGERNIYIEFARQQLESIELKKWSCLQQRIVTDGQLEVLLSMEIGTVSGPQFLYELALLIDTEAGWRYHSAQKLSADDYIGTPEKIDFSLFDTVGQKIRF